MEQILRDWVVYREHTKKEVLPQMHPRFKAFLNGRKAGSYDGMIEDVRTNLLAHMELDRLNFIHDSTKLSRDLETGQVVIEDFVEDESLDSISGPAYGLCLKLYALMHKKYPGLQISIVNEKLQNKVHTYCYVQPRGTKLIVDSQQIEYDKFRTNSLELAEKKPIYNIDFGSNYSKINVYNRSALNMKTTSSSTDLAWNYLSEVSHNQKQREIDFIGMDRILNQADASSKSSKLIMDGEKPNDFKSLWIYTLHGGEELKLVNANERLKSSGWLGMAVVRPSGAVDSYSFFDPELLQICIQDKKAVNFITNMRAKLIRSGMLL